MVNPPAAKVSNKAKWIFVSCTAAAAVVAGLIWLFQPDEELDNTIDALNNFGAVQEHNGHVEDVTWVEFPQRPNADGSPRRGPSGGRGGGRMFEADVLDDDGNLIGKVRGFRVEGLGTSVRQSRWKDKGDDLNAPWPERRRGPRGPGGRGPRGNRPPDGGPAPEGPPPEGAPPVPKS